ncbi:MAG TPA: sugar ABC transporter substrate-binding protein [Thermoleophilaceae bacterium]|nr:sugar ABC transporter substrate-binding protein [Thermoleophilaceae bacterium]
MTAAAVLLTALAAGCGSDDDTSGESGQGGDGLRLGQVLFGVDAYQQNHEKYFVERAEELGAEVQTVNGENSQPTQDRVVRDLINAGVDAMIIQPPDPGAATGTVRAIQDADIPVIVWGNGEVQGIDPAPYIALDDREQSREAGANAARAVEEAFPGEPVRMVTITIPGVPICEDFRMGPFVEGVKSVAPDAQVVAQPDGAGVRAQSNKVMEDVIRSGDDFNLVTACNGESALGALSALERAGRGKASVGDDGRKVPETEYVFTIDGSPAEVEKLTDPRSSVMEVLMLTPYENARKLAELTIRHARGRLGDDYRDTVTGTLVGPDCAEANRLLEREYGETVDC